VTLRIDYTSHSGLHWLLAGIEAVSEQIREYNQGIECLAEKSYPQVQLMNSSNA
jgi:hypothetical protein